jgi:hypothetical protein
MNKFNRVGSSINKVQSISKRHLFERTLYFYLTEKDTPFSSSRSIARANKPHRTVVSVVTSIAG